MNREPLLKSRLEANEKNEDSGSCWELLSVYLPKVSVRVGVSLPL